MLAAVQRRRAVVPAEEQDPPEDVTSDESEDGEQHIPMRSRGGQTGRVKSFGGQPAAGRGGAAAGFSGYEMSQQAAAAMPPPPGAPTQFVPEQGWMQRMGTFLHEALGDYKPVAKNAMFGLGIGLAYGMFSNMTRRRDVLFELNPIPEAFYIDPRMSKLFNKLAQFREWNEEAYVSALENTDRLLQLEDAIRMRGPEIGDLSMAETWINSVHAALVEFRERIHSPRARVDCQRVESSICIRLDIHNRNIRRRCSVLYPNFLLE